MAKVEGYSCDVCTKYGQGEKGTTAKPAGWYELKLPASELDYGEASRLKDICSATCLAKFARERKQAVEGTSAERNNRSKPEILAAYEAASVPPAERGAMSRKHNREHLSPEDADSGCIPCLVEYGSSTPA